MSAYTKGPWHIVKKHYGMELESVDLNGDGDHVGMVNIYGKADARLIAAAPDLLTSALAAYHLLADITHQWRGRHTPDGQRLLIDLRDAIAKATGMSAEDVQDDASSPDFDEFEKERTS